MSASLATSERRREGFTLTWYWLWKGQRDGQVLRARSARVKDLRGTVGDALQLIADDSQGQVERQGLPRFDPRGPAGSVLAPLSIERQSQQGLVQKLQAWRVRLQ